MDNFPSSLSFIFFTFIILFTGNSHSGVAQELGFGNGLNILLQTIVESIDSLSVKLERDLDEKFRKLSSQVEANDRKVSKTLSIFESDWKEKADRLTAVEKRQDATEHLIMKLSTLVHKLGNAKTGPAQATTQASVSPGENEEDYDDRSESYEENSKNYEVSHEELEFDAKSEVIFVDPTMTATSFNGIQNDASYYLSGTPSLFETLKPIPESEQRELSSIELHYVNIEPEILLTSLRNCSKLRSLKLIQVKFEKPLNGSDRPVLPLLEEFVLHQVGVLNFRNDSIFSKWTEIDEFLKNVDKAQLQRLIFFDKSPVGIWEVDRLTSLGTSIELLTDGIRILSLDFENGELSSMLKYTNDLLKHIDSDFLLRKLAISVWRIDLGLLPDSITHLNLNYVLDSNEVNFHRKIEDLRSLQDLNIFLGNQRDFGWSLASIPKLQLKNLTIRYSDIREFPTNTLLRLDHLYFHLCEMDLAFAQAFPRVFEALYVGVTFRKDSDSYHHSFLHNILTTPVRRVFMQNFSRNNTKGRSDPYFRETEHFLAKTGIRKDVEHFVLLNWNGAWQGIELGDVELAFQTLQLVGTDKFVTFEAYQKIIT